MYRLTFHVPMPPHPTRVTHSHWFFLGLVIIAVGVILTCVSLYESDGDMMVGGLLSSGIGVWSMMIACARPHVRRAMSLGGGLIFRRVPLSVDEMPLWGEPVSVAHKQAGHIVITNRRLLYVPFRGTPALGVIELAEINRITGSGPTLLHARGVKIKTGTVAWRFTPTSVLASLRPRTVQRQLLANLRWAVENAPTLG